MVCAHSGIEVPEEDEFVCPGCCRNHRIQIIIELVFNLIWVGHFGCIGTHNCCMPRADKGSLSVIRWSFNAFWKSWKLADRVWLDGKSYSCFTQLFYMLTPKESVTSTRFFLKALPLQGESHSKLQSRLCSCQVLCQLDLFFAKVCQNQYCSLECAHSMRRLLNVSPSSSFFLVRQLSGIPTDRC